MTSNDKRHGSIATRPATHEMRVIATYEREEETALTKTQFFDATTTLQDLLHWAKEAEAIGIKLAGLEIEVKDTNAS